MEYISTRPGNCPKISSAEAIKSGISPDGGLYMPRHIPTLSQAEISSLTNVPYPRLAAKILAKFLTDYREDELSEDTAAAYGADRFDGAPAPVTELSDLFVLELFHGPTCAFKDMALQLMPRLFARALVKCKEGKNALILTATSGDTGKAALEGYRDIPGIGLLVFYPTDGVSALQKLQMQTQEGRNVGVCAIRGNFDDAQSGVKAIFADKDVADALDAKGKFLSSANSINFGRLAPQIVYYISAYCDLIKNKQIAYGERVNVCVPTGNFGNILAAYIAKRMGLPLGRLICASNSNNVLTDFFDTGVYDRNRPFHATVSPSMDILISSKLERLLWFAAGEEETKRCMNELASSGRYAVSPAVKAELDRDFVAFWCDENETKEEIRRIYGEFNYLSDTHTAVALNAARKYKENTGDDAKIIIASTASPYKFAPAVCSALGIDYDGDEFAAIDALSGRTGVPVPENLASLLGKAPRFTDVIERGDMKERVLAF